MNKVCINCAYFLNCDEAEKNKEICKKYIKAQRKLEKVEDFNFKFRKVEE